MANTGTLSNNYFVTQAFGLLSYSYSEPLHDKNQLHVPANDMSSQGRVQMQIKALKMSSLVQSSPCTTIHAGHKYIR